MFRIALQSFFLMAVCSLATAQGLREKFEAEVNEGKEIREWAKNNTIGFMCGNVNKSLSRDQLFADFFKGGRCSRATGATLSIACYQSHRIILIRTGQGQGWQIASWMTEISINPQSDKWIPIGAEDTGGGKIITDGNSSREFHAKDNMYYEEKIRNMTNAFKCYPFRIGEF